MLSIPSWMSTLSNGPCVQMAVVLHGRHQLGDPSGGVADLADQALHIEAGRQPAEGVGRVRTGGGHDPIQPRLIEPGRSKDRRQLPGVVHAGRLQAVGQGVFEVARLQGGEARAQLELARGLR